MSKRYIGVDLGAWLSNKTRIATLEIVGNKLELLNIKKEPALRNEYPEVRNKKLVDYLQESDEKDVIIAIDAPFAVPSPLTGIANMEQYYSGFRKKEHELSEKERQKIKKLSIQNQYLYDNSARFVYEKTYQFVLAPTATLIGALTSRMIHIIDNYSSMLGINKTPFLKTVQLCNKQISTIEVFPTATLYQMIRTLSIAEQKKYLHPQTNEEERSRDVSRYTKIISYKGNNWSSTKEQMLKLIKPFVDISYERKNEIKTDDDYDAIICALTAYFIDTHGYEKPNCDDIDKFTNSFIYIPKL